jgi:LmbE family N-acetylglucosaminyl deacetylase
MSDPKGISGPAAARSALRKAREEQAARVMGVPSIHLLIYPTPDCMRLSLVIYYTRPGMRRTCKVLREAQWRPKEVSEQKLIDWAQRALAGWLEAETLPPEEEDLRKGW